MKRQLKLAVLLTAILTGPALGNEWKKIDESEGIKLFSKTVPNSPLVAFKGVMVMNQPVAKVAQVLLDPNPKTRLDWIDMVMEFNFLSYEPYKAIAYSSYKLPWPLSNRDYIIQISLSIEKQKNKVFVYLKSIEHPDAPPTIGVRAELINSLYELEPLDDNTTRVTVEIQTDPKGNIPTWIVNLVQKGWPANTLKAMATQAAKPENIPNKIVMKELGQK